MYSALHNFNPRSPHGERQIVWEYVAPRLLFQSTLPARGATRSVLLVPPRSAFQSTLPARGATCAEVIVLQSPAISIHAPRTGSDVAGYQLPRAAVISIHAPRTGSDAGVGGRTCATPYFNPRSPHGERHAHICDGVALTQFQSTLPARGATIPESHERRIKNISIHAPRTGSDQVAQSLIICAALFQSTLPARGATMCTVTRCSMWKISIHAPRTGSDPLRTGLPLLVCISIHAPRTGSDLCPDRLPCWKADFNPRSPHGERPTGKADAPSPWHFNPRSPHGERRR